MFNFADIKEANPIIPAKRSDPNFPKKVGISLVDVLRNKEDQSFTFVFVEKATSATLNHREFKPSRTETMTDEAYKQSVSMGVNRIAHIYRAFATEEQFMAVKVEDPNNPAKYVENWLAITKMVGASLKSMIEAKKDMSCDLKVTLRKSTKEGKTQYFSSLPMVPPFISTTNHPKEFLVNPQYDIFEVPDFKPDNEQPAQQGANAGQAAQSPLAGMAATNSGNSDF